MNGCAELLRSITAAATLGTNRTGVPKGLIDTPIDPYLAQLKNDDLSKHLLDTIALSFAFDRAGAIPQTSDIEFAEPADPEVLPSCSDSAASALQEVIEGRYRNVLPEALHHLTKSKQRVPFHFLPTLLDIGYSDESLRDGIRKVVGNRGLWLATFEERWGYLRLENLQDPDMTIEEYRGHLVDTWAKGRTKDRLALLTTVRQTYPKIGLELIEGDWNSETNSNRLLLVQALQSNLTIADQNFLEMAVDDKSPDVRKAAQSLLLSIPGSQFSLHAFSIAQSLMSITKTLSGNLQFAVSLPQSYEPAWKRFGIEAESWIKDVDDQSWWFIQWVSLIPPEYWSSVSGASPETLLSVAGQTEWADTIRLAWTKSSRLSTDMNWKYEVLKYWLYARDPRTTISSFLPQINDIGNYAEDLINAMLDTDVTLLHDGHYALGLLQRYTKPWGVELSIRVIRQFQQRAAERASNSTPDWLCTRLLRDSASRVPADIYKELSTGWPNAHYGQRKWLDSADYFCTTLHLRHKLLREFQQ